MLRAGEIRSRLYERLRGKAEDVYIEEANLGLCYAGVRLRGGGAGVAALLRSRTLQPAVAGGWGHVRGQRALRVLDFLISGQDAAERALGLATANAILNPPAPEREADTIDLMALSSRDRMAMVGFFPPLVERIRRTGSELAVVEEDEGKPGISEPSAVRKALEECTVAVITATTLLNETLEEVLGALGAPRHVALLKPSTPALPNIFRGTPMRHLGGASILEEREVMRVIAAGGGTPVMRPYLRFWNMPVGTDLFPSGARPDAT